MILEKNMLDWNNPLGTNVPERKANRLAENTRQEASKKIAKGDTDLSANPNKNTHQHQSIMFEDVANTNNGEKAIHVDEKRVLNSSADINQLAPFK